MCTRPAAQQLLDVAWVEGDLVEAVAAKDGGGAQPAGGVVGMPAGPVADGVRGRHSHR